MSELKISGKVTVILQVENGTSKAGKEWKKQDFVIETGDKYPALVCFTLFGDKLSLLNGVSVGDEVDVSFNIESREYNGRYFHNINAWKVESTNKAEQQSPPGPQQGNKDGEDLPFN